MGRLILACLLALSAAVSIDAAKIAAFNIQVFGVSKIGEPVVVSYLVQVTALVSKTFLPFQEKKILLLRSV